jgi:hypothetical protein
MGSPVSNNPAANVMTDLRAEADITNSGGQPSAELEQNLSQMMQQLSPGQLHGVLESLVGQNSQLGDPMGLGGGPSVAQDMFGPGGLPGQGENLVNELTQAVEEALQQHHGHHEPQGETANQLPKNQVMQPGVE